MSSKDIREKEVLIQVTQDSRRRSLRATDLAIKPKVERPTSRAAGEKRDQGDIDVSGFDVTFKTSIPDHVWYEIMKETEEAERLGTTMPEVSIAVTFAYRAGIGSRTVTLAGNGATLFPDDITVPGKGYVMASWTGFFPEMTST